MTYFGHFDANLVAFDQHVGYFLNGGKLRDSSPFVLSALLLSVFAFSSSLFFHLIFQRSEKLKTSSHSTKNTQTHKHNSFSPLLSSWMQNLNPLHLSAFVAEVRLWSAGPRTPDLQLLSDVNIHKANFSPSIFLPSMFKLCYTLLQACLNRSLPNINTHIITHTHILIVSAHPSWSTHCFSLSD